MAFELQNGTKYILINTRKVGQDYGCCTGITAYVCGTDFFFLVTFSQYMWFLLFEISQNLEELASVAAFIEFLNSIYLPLYM